MKNARRIGERTQGRAAAGEGVSARGAAIAAAISEEWGDQRRDRGEEIPAIVRSRIVTPDILPGVVMPNVMLKLLYDEFSIAHELRLMASCAPFAGHRRDMLLTPACGVEQSTLMSDLNRQIRRCKA
jgi:hypothetical protein